MLKLWSKFKNKHNIELSAYIDQTEMLDLISIETRKLKLLIYEASKFRISFLIFLKNGFSYCSIEIPKKDLWFTLKIIIIIVINLIFDEDLKIFNN